MMRPQTCYFLNQRQCLGDVGLGDHLCHRKGYGNNEGTPREFGSICIMVFTLVGSPQEQEKSMEGCYNGNRCD